MRALVLAFVSVFSLITISQSAHAVALKDLSEDQLKEHIEYEKTFAQIKGMMKIVDVLNQSDLSCKTVSDCTALPIGHRACGGPNSFIVASKLNPSLAALTQSIELVTKAERDANSKLGLMSICSVEMPPTVGCNSGVCEAL